MSPNKMENYQGSVSEGNHKKLSKSFTIVHNFDKLKKANMSLTLRYSC